MESGIYTITNLINNKVLVGQSTNVERRFKEHKSELLRGIHKNQYLQSAWNKYGEDSFAFEAIEYIEKEFLLSHELYWSNILDSHNKKKGYNLKSCAPIGCGSLTQETKNKISKANKGRKFSEAQILALKIRLTGVPLSAQHKINIGKANKGKKRSLAQKQTIKDSMVGRVYSTEQLAIIAKARAAVISKPIIDKCTNFIYPTVRNCMLTLGINYVVLTNNIKGKIRPKDNFKLAYYVMDNEAGSS